MITQASEYIDAATHLPNGARLVLSDVSWDSYERLLLELGDRANLRLSFDSGRLEIMSPSLVVSAFQNGWL